MASDFVASIDRLLGPEPPVTSIEERYRTSASSTVISEAPWPVSPNGDWEAQLEKRRLKECADKLGVPLDKLDGYMFTYEWQSQLIDEGYLDIYERKKLHRSDK